MSLIAASFLLLTPPTGADAAEVQEREEETIAAAMEADAGADFVPSSPDASEAENAADGEPDHPEARLYDATIDASAAVDAALNNAGKRGVNVMLVLGANWCHDSRAFAGWSETEKIGGLIEERFELVFVNVGMPQTKDGHNLHIADRFKLSELEGTPTVAVISSNGDVLNRDTAKSWRNTASRSEDEIFEELALLATTELARE